MMKHAFYFMLMSLFMVACSKSEPTLNLSDISDYESNVGWLHGNCLAIKNNNVVAKTQLTIVHLDEAHTVSNASILNLAMGSEDCYALSEDRWEVNMDSGFIFYAIESSPVVELGIAVLGKVNDLSPYVFDSCSTSEGILFSLRKRNLKKTKDLWNGYYYLGYDVESTCDVVPAQ